MQMMRILTSITECKYQYDTIDEFKGSRTKEGFQCFELPIKSSTDITISFSQQYFRKSI